MLVQEVLNGGSGGNREHGEGRPGGTWHMADSIQSAKARKMAPRPLGENPRSSPLFANHIAPVPLSDSSLAAHSARGKNTNVSYRCSRVHFIYIYSCSGCDYACFCVFNSKPCFSGKLHPKPVESVHCQTFWVLHEKQNLLYFYADICLLITRK